MPEVVTGKRVLRSRLGTADPDALPSVQEIDLGLIGDWGIELLRIEHLFAQMDLTAGAAAMLHHTVWSVVSANKDAVADNEFNPDVASLVEVLDLEANYIHASVMQGHFLEDDVNGSGGVSVHIQNSLWEPSHPDDHLYIGSNMSHILAGSDPNFNAVVEMFLTYRWVRFNQNELATLFARRR